MRAPRCIFVSTMRTTLVLRALVGELCSACCRCLPATEVFLGFGPIVELSDRVQVCGSGVVALVLAMIPRPIVNGIVGAPRRVEVSGRTTHEECALVVKLLDTSCRCLPSTIGVGKMSHVRTDIRTVLVGVTCVLAVAPVGSCLALHMVVMMHAPRCVVIHRRTTVVHCAFILKLGRASRRLFPSACVGHSGWGAGTGKAALRMAPGASLLHICSGTLAGYTPCSPARCMEAIFLWHIALNEGPWILFDRWLMLKKAWCDWSRGASGPRIFQALLRAGVGAACSQLGEEPASIFRLQAVAGDLAVPRCSGGWNWDRCRCRHRYNDRHRNRYRHRQR